MPAKLIPAGRPATFHYREALRQLNQARAPYLVGGTYAFQAHTRIHRPTKDLDLFVNEADRDRVLETLHDAGWETRVEVPHWLAKARRGETFVDVIHSSGNGVARVDDLWLTHSVPGRVLGVETRLVPVEEMIWSKAFVMENYRFDGADVAHLLLIQGHRIDWDRLLLRFGRNWRVLLGHLLFFGFIYPEKQSLVPQAFLDTLLARLRREADEPLDRYRVDLTFHGHAHKGSVEGATRGGRRVYNVALPLLRDTRPERLPFVVEIPSGKRPG